MSADRPRAPRREHESVRSSYADLVAALLGHHPDPTSQRFDTELDRAVRNGRLDRATARTLRWWQRRSVQAAISYAEQVIPDALSSRDEATVRAHADASDAATSWGRATRRATRTTWRATRDARELRPASRRMIVVDLTAVPARPREHLTTSCTTVTVDLKGLHP